MKRILCSLLVATLPLGSVLAEAPQSKDAKVTLVYQHELPNVPGKSIKGVLVEYGPGGYSPGHMHPRSAFIYATVLEGAIRSQVNDGPVTTYKAGESFSELPGDRHRVQCQCQRDRAGQAPRGVRLGHERNGTDDPIREMRCACNCGLQRDQRDVRLSFEMGLTSYIPNRQLCITGRSAVSFDHLVGRARSLAAEMDARGPLCARVILLNRSGAINRKSCTPGVGISE